MADMEQAIAEAVEAAVTDPHSAVGRLVASGIRVGFHRGVRYARSEITLAMLGVPLPPEALDPDAARRAEGLTPDP